jgi:hypothetical protein
LLLLLLLLLLQQVLLKIHPLLPFIVTPGPAACDTAGVHSRGGRHSPTHTLNVSPSSSSRTNTTTTSIGPCTCISTPPFITIRTASNINTTTPSTADVLTATIWICSSISRLAAAAIADTAVVVTRVTAAATAATAAAAAALGPHSVFGRGCGLSMVQIGFPSARWVGQVFEHDGWQLLLAVGCDCCLC